MHPIAAPFQGIFVGAGADKFPEPEIFNHAALSPDARLLSRLQKGMDDQASRHDGPARESDPRISGPRDQSKRCPLMDIS